MSILKNDMKTKLIKNWGVKTLVFVYLLASFSMVLAQGQGTGSWDDGGSYDASGNREDGSIPYTPLEQLPRVGNNGATTIPDEEAKLNLVTYLPDLIKLAIGIAAALSVIYIIIGGFQYLTTDAVFEKGEGKKRIQNAVWGLLLAISAVIILNTISPRLTNVNLDITAVAPGTGPSVPSGGEAGSPGQCRAYGGGTRPCVCNDCTAPVGIFRFKPGVNHSMNSTLIQKLESAKGDMVYRPAGAQGVNRVPIDWYITEAWPPQVPHIDSCHYDGTCIDLNMIPGYIAGSNPTQNDALKINAIIEAVQDQGLTIIFEAPNADINKFVQLGVKRDFMRIYNTTTAPSFHVELK